MIGKRMSQTHIKGVLYVHTHTHTHAHAHAHANILTHADSVYIK